jgi:predicted amidohydrolase
LDREGTVEKACNLIREAGSKGARIIVFPENFIPAHPFWYDSLRIDEGTSKFYKRLFENAVEIPSTATGRLCEAAKDADAYVVMGLTEKEPRTLGTLYNALLFIDKNGSVMGKHRKIAPTGAERLVHTGGDGSTLSVFKTEFGELGGLICGEHTNSLARFALLAQGEKIHAASWPPFEESRKYGMDIRIKYHAFEGKVFVISSCSCIDAATAEKICNSEQNMKTLMERGGGSCIVGPDGRYIAGPLNKGEGIVYGDINIEKIIDGKYLQDVIGHYNRFDIFKLVVNRTKREALVKMEE